MLHFTAAFFALFVIFFRIALQFCRRKFKGNDAETKGIEEQFSSYIVASIHGCLSSLFALTLLLNSNEWTDFDSTNKPIENVALAFSLGYFFAVRNPSIKHASLPLFASKFNQQPQPPPVRFYFIKLKHHVIISTSLLLQDTAAYLIPYTPHEYIYILHHAVTIAFVAASLHAQRGANAVLFGIFTGEVTNPLFHIYNVTKALRTTHSWADKGFKLWTPMFTSIFVCIRSIFGIPASIWWSMKIYSMNEVSIIHKGIWIVAALGITSVSQLFSYGFLKESIELVMENNHNHSNNSGVLSLIDGDGKVSDDTMKHKYNVVCNSSGIDTDNGRLSIDESKTDGVLLMKQTYYSSTRRRRGSHGLTLYDSANDMHNMNR